MILAKEKFGLRGRSLQDKDMEFIPFTATTRMSGVDFDGNEIRKGAADAVRDYVTEAGGMYSARVRPSRKAILQHRAARLWWLLKITRFWVLSI